MNLHLIILIDEFLSKMKLPIEKYLEPTPVSYIKDLKKKDIWRELEKSPNAGDLFRPTGDDTIGKCFEKCRESGISFPRLNPGRKSRSKDI